MGSFHTAEAWLTGTVLTIILVVAGLGIVLRSHRRDHRAVAGQLGVLILGLLVVGIALNGAAPTVAKWAANMFTS